MFVCVLIISGRWAMTDYTTCKHCFSETHGTPFFELKTPTGEVIRTLAMFPEKGSIRGVARASGHSKDTVQRWIRVASEHCKEVTEYFSILT